MKSKCSCQVSTGMSKMPASHVSISSQLLTSNGSYWHVAFGLAYCYCQGR